jgi:hypothetical protein
MTDRRRQILERVASGELTPEEAVALLDHARPQPETAGAPRPATVAVIVEADLGAVAIVADDTVDDAVAIGAHELRRAGNEIRITGTKDRSILSDGRLLPRRGRRHALRVRIRPDLPLKVKLGAGTVHVEGLQARCDIEVDLGTATLEQLGGEFDVRVASGNVSVAGLMQSGTSSISCDLATVNVRLQPKSSVRVTATTDAGRITLPGARSRPAIVFGTKAEAVVGGGDAQLDIRAAAGTIAVKVER